MLRRVRGAGQGRAGGRGQRVRLPACSAWLSGWVLSAWVLGAGQAQAAEPFPPGEASEHFDAQARAGKKDIVATLQADTRFSALARAIEVAGLTPMLRARGPLTVFAPTNVAFDKLPAGRLDQWLKQPKVLRAILRYHLLKAYVPSKQLSRLRNALTAAAVVVSIDGSSGVKVNGVSVISADVYASNGVIHAIDTILVPPEAKSLGKKKRSDKGKTASPDDSQPPEEAEAKP